MTYLEDLSQRERSEIDRLIDLALDEDIGSGDATTNALFEEGGKVHAMYVARTKGIMAGGAVVGRLFERLGARYFNDAATVVVTPLIKDGLEFNKGEKLISITGECSPILIGERTSLNMLQRLCGVATRTRSFVNAVCGFTASILDTRKTMPGFRALDKMAVRCGGGVNHRRGLYDMVLIKDNHLAHYGSPSAAVFQARKSCSLPIMVEVDTIDQLRDALIAQPDYILLDNMVPDELMLAVKVTNDKCRDESLKRPLLEASGGVSLETVAAVAATGVDRISVGSLTHGVGGLDIGLDFI